MGGLLPPAEVTPASGSSSTGAGSGAVAIRHPGSGPTDSGSSPVRAANVHRRARFRRPGPPKSYRHLGERVADRPAPRNRCAGAPNQYRSTGSARTTWYERPVAQPWRRGLRSGYAPDQRPSRGARGPHRSDPRHQWRSRQEYPREAVAEVPPLRNCHHARRVRRVRLPDGREALVSPPFGNARDAEPSRGPIRRPAHAERDPDRPVRVSSRRPPGHPRAPAGAPPSPPRPGRRPQAWRGCSRRGRQPSSR